eukprot:364050-Chlamydomonas_euryale.AAC.15
MELTSWSGKMCSRRQRVERGKMCERRQRVELGKMCVWGGALAKTRHLAGDGADFSLHGWGVRRCAEVAQRVAEGDTEPKTAPAVALT